MMTDADFTPAGGGGNNETTNHEVDEGTLDRAFDLLGSRQRRYALEKLRATAGGVASVDDLADHVVARAPEATDRKRVEVALYHRILPKLADDGIVDFEPGTATARYHESELIEDVLDLVATQTE